MQIYLEVKNYIDLIEYGHLKENTQIVMDIMKSSSHHLNRAVCFIIYDHL